MKDCKMKVMRPKVTKYNVVKNNKTPSGPMSVGDVKQSMRIKAASPTMLMQQIMRLCFITFIIPQLVGAPKFWKGAGVIRR